MDREALRVLVCDDEMGMRLGVERALCGFTVEVPGEAGATGFAVTAAETGEEALAAFRATPFDIVLLDHKLPGMSGLEVLEQIRAADTETMVIMITAYASIETAVTATKQGAYDFLPKPFTPLELKNTVGKAARHLLLAAAARRLAEEKRRVRFEFIRVLGHELKAPLNAVEGFLNIVIGRTAGENEAVYEEMLGRSVMRLQGMRKLIGDLLDMTRIESGEGRRELQELDLRSVATDALELVAPDAEARGITVCFPPGPPVPFRADRTEMDMVFNNLISNAVKYNRDNGRVRVRLAADGAEVVFAVEDTGIGMTEAEAAKLFQDFVRIKNKKTQRIDGSGLGLSTVRKIAELYGGTARVESTPDVGSTFTVTLHAAP